MSKQKNKRRHLTREDIRKARSEGNVQVRMELAQRMLNGEPLSVAEADEAASFLRHCRPEDSICRVDLATIAGAQDAIFTSLYPLYAEDLEGRYGIVKFSGYDGLMTRVVSIEEKREDVAKLDEYYRQWNKVFGRNNHSDQLLNLVINEVNKDLKVIDGELAAGNIKREEYNYKRKSIVLHSKFIFLRVKRIFEDSKNTNIIVHFGGLDIEITPWSMVHVLNRHYAKKIKQYVTGKSYHGDAELPFFEDPERLRDILEKIASHAEARKCNVDYIVLKFNGLVYTIYTQLQTRHIGGKKTFFRQLQTFFPLEDPNKLQDIQDNYVEFVVDTNLSGFRPR